MWCDAVLSASIMGIIYQCLPKNDLNSICQHLPCFVILSRTPQPTTFMPFFERARKFTINGGNFTSNTYITNHYHATSGERHWHWSNYIFLNRFHFGQVCKFYMIILYLKRHMILLLAQKHHPAILTHANNTLTISPLGFMPTT